MMDSNPVKKTFYARYSVITLLLIMFILPPLGAWVKRSLENSRNNVKEWLPDDYEETASHRWFQKNFPNEQFILMSWNGCTLDDPRLALMPDRLLPDRDKDGKILDKDWDLRYFERVNTGSSIIDELLSNYPSMNRKEAISRLEGSLIGLDRISTSLIIILRSGSEGENLRKPVEAVYAAAAGEFTFIKDEKTGRYRAFQEGKDPEEKKQTLPGLKRTEVYLGGPPVDNIAIDVEGQRTLMRLAWLSGIVGLLIATVCFRSPRLIFMVFTSALLATGLSLAVVSISGVTTDAIMFSMPALVYVLGMSGAIHIVNYYHDAIAENKGLNGAPELAIKHAFMPCFVSAFTTALGLLSLLTSSLAPIYKFGLFSAIGVMLTLLVLFMYLPSLLQEYPSRKYAEKVVGKKHFASRNDHVDRFWNSTGQYIINNPYLVLAICFGIMVGAALGLPKLEFSVKLMKFFTKDTTIVRDYTWLENQLGPLVPMEVVIKFDNETNKESMSERLRLIQKVSEKAKAHDEVGGVISAVTVTPDIRSVGSGVAERTLNRKLAENYHKMSEYVTYDLESAEKKYALKHDGASPPLKEFSFPQPILEKLQALGIKDLAQLRAAAEKNPSLGMSDDIFHQVKMNVFQWQIDHGDELWRVTGRVWALTDLDYGYFMDELRETLTPVVDKHKADKKVEGVCAIFTGAVPLVYKTQHELMKSLIMSILLAFVTIAAVMAIVLRSFVAGLMAMIPNVFPIVVVFGVMGWLGIKCDLGAMMTASVAMGIAVDDTIHYLSWYRRALDEGYHPSESVLVAYRRCGTAMTETTLISAFGLSVFAFSTFTPTLTFGLMMLVLLIMALYGDLIFLPAILIGMGGNFFGTVKDFPDGKRPSSIIYQSSLNSTRKTIPNDEEEDEDADDKKEEKGEKPDT